MIQRHDNLAQRVDGQPVSCHRAIVILAWFIDTKLQAMGRNKGFLYKTGHVQMRSSGL